jgi:hypothetical protein
MGTMFRRRWQVTGIAVAACSALLAVPARAGAAEPDYQFHDSHFHLTNYVQQGTDIQRFLEIMGTG